jgi:two-component system cell cycle sensor histidine kinase/response regulator CckA
MPGVRGSGLRGPAIASSPVERMDYNTWSKHEWPGLLVVDDDDGLRALAGAILMQEGYKVVTTGSPFEAMDILDRGPDDIRLIITDIFMPGMTGFALGSWVRATQPDVKILYMSAYTHRVPRSLCPEEVFLPKPFSRKGLAGRVRHLIQPPPKESGPAHLLSQ